MVDPNQIQTRLSSYLAHQYNLSLFLLISLIGILTNDVSLAVENISKGNFNVLEYEHTVVLGWNRQTIPLIKQVALVAEGVVLTC